MTHPRRPMATLLVGALLALGATACGGGGSGKHATTSTGATSTAPIDTTATGAPSPRTKSGKPSLADTPVKTLTFSGSGIKDIGKPAPLRLPTNSTIKWTNDGTLFQIIPASTRVTSPVNSRDHSGEAKIRKGSYHGFLVNAIGHWTISIVPGG